MRLIDADTLNFSTQNYSKAQIKAILDFIDAQPTVNSCNWISCVDHLPNTMGIYVALCKDESGQEFVSDVQFTSNEFRTSDSVEVIGWIDLPLTDDCY